MGQTTEDILDGTCCDICGIYFKGKKKNTLYTHEYPVTCWDCWKNLTEEEKGLHQKALVRTL
jgi:hypothetical protein